MSGIQEKLNIFRIRKPFYFLTLSIILAVVFFFSFLGNLKFYRSEISILFIPKSEEVILQSEQIIQNIIELPYRLSFYEKVLKDNKNIDDQLVGYSKDKRKELWSKKLKIDRRKNSGVIDIKIDARNRKQSEAIVEQTVFTLFGSVSQYYDVKKDIDLRIVDGPITSAHAANIPWLASLSLVAGIALSYLSHLISGSFIEIIHKRKVSPIETGNKNSEEYEKELSAQEELTQPAMKKYQAPGNLPVADDA
ncbi:MAG TPA: hypothetical protein ENG89_01100, partial [Candidatus Moranbacteria bacterium]|nr:hypothetical protein [Candidatus Moranbacteria bacterium]